MQDPRVAIERLYRFAPMSNFESAEEALLLLRQIKPDSTSLVEKIFRHIVPAPMRDAVLYDLIITRSIMDLRILHTMNLVMEARRLRWLRNRLELGMALHPRVGLHSKLGSLDPSLVKIIFELCDQ